MTGDDEPRDGAADPRAMATTAPARPSDAASLDSDVAALRAIAGMRPRPTATVLRPGTDLDGYRIEGPLGAGGMGVVYLARDRQLGRPVAIKLHARTDDDDGTARLLREARAMAALAHPNVITVYEVGTHDGHLFIAMAYLDGGTARTWRAARPRTWREIVAVYLAAGRGLAAAHRAGLVHRDFKPDNVLLGKDGEVRVADFGLARLGSEPVAALATVDAAAAAVTMTGVVLGTPLYMAPEQRLGTAGPAADQFAFCVALWEALAGAPPFAGDTTGELDRAVRAGRLRPLPPGRAIPRHLRRALLRGFAVEPADRHPTMDALLAALARDPARTWRRAALGVAAAAALGGGALALSSGSRTAIPAIADPCAGGEERAAATWSPARQAALTRAFAAQGPAGVDAARIAATTLDYYLGQWLTLRTSSCRASDPATRATHLACFDRALDRAGVLIDLLGQPNHAALELAVTAIDELPPPTACVGQAALFPEPTDPAIANEVRAVRALLDRAFARYTLSFEDRGLAIVSDAVTRADALGWAPLRAEAHALFGNVLWVHAQDDAARTQLQQAYDDATASGYASAQASAAGYLCMFQVEPTAGETWAKRALPLIERTARGSVLEANTRNSYGGWLDALGRSGDAITQHVRALEVLTALRLDRDITFANTLRFLASSQAVVGARAEAITNYKRAITLIEQLKGANNPGLIKPLAELAFVYLDEQRPGDALDDAARAVAIADGVRANHPLNRFHEAATASAEHARGRALLRLGKRKDANASLARAAIGLRATLDPGDPELAMLRQDLLELGR